MPEGVVCVGLGLGLGLGLGFEKFENINHCVRTCLKVASPPAPSKLGYSKSLIGLSPRVFLEHPEHYALRHPSFLVPFSTLQSVMCS